MTTNNPQIAFPSIDQVKVADDFLGRLLRRNRTDSLPHIIDKLYEPEVGIVDNFRRAAGRLDGDFIGLHNSDEFLYKTLEAGAYELHRTYDVDLDRRLDAIIGEVAAAQEHDGYLRTPHTIYWLRGGQTPRAPRWAKLNGDLELYSLGHLIEAAVAHHSATGKRNLLDVATKAADLVDSLFGVGKRIRGVDMIPEIELALVRLAETTGEYRYARLAKYFVEERGNAEGHELMGEFALDHRPLREQPEAVGHATFAVYLYSAAADLVRLGMDADYVPALHRLWQDLVETKMSINGGLGSCHENEGFGRAFYLPNRTAYNEICAGVGFILCNQRMFRIDPDSKYFDVAERTLYNNILSGVSHDGRGFFYVCPTESDKYYKFNLGWCPDDYHGPYGERTATRKPWLPCACCPPTLARLLPQLPSMAVATDDSGLYVNLYVGGDSALSIAGQPVGLTCTTNYPWDGLVSLRLRLAPPSHFALRLRLPAWLDSVPVQGRLYRFADRLGSVPALRVNGKDAEFSVRKGYANVERVWENGDTIELVLPLAVRRVLCDPRVPENVGRIAIQRGPVLYCAEAVDNGGSALDLCVPDTAELVVRRDATLFDGTMKIEGEALKLSASGKAKPHHIVLIPYYLWSNRGENEMAVWLRRS